MARNAAEYTDISHLDWEDEEDEREQNADDADQSNDNDAASDQDDADDRDDAGDRDTAGDRDAAGDGRGKDDQQAAGDRDQAGDERSAGDREQTTDQRAARDRDLSDDDVSTDRRFTGDRPESLSSLLALNSPGIEHSDLRDVYADDVEMRMKTNFKLDNIPILNEDHKLNFVGIGIGKSDQHAAMNDALNAFREASNQHASTWSRADLHDAATGVVDRILSRYGLEAERLEAHLAYNLTADLRSQNPSMMDVTSLGEKKLLNDYRNELVNAFVAAGDRNDPTTQAQATGYAMHTLSDLESLMEKRQILNDDGNLSELRLAQYENRMLREQLMDKGLTVASQASENQDLRNQLEFAMNIAAVASDNTAAAHGSMNELSEFMQKDGLTRFVERFDHLSDSQKAAFDHDALESRVSDLLDARLPESGLNDGANAIREAILADYPGFFHDAALDGGDDLKGVKDNLDALLGKVSGMEFQALTADDFASAERLEILMGHLRSNEDPNFAAAVAALDDQSTRDLVSTISAQASEYYDNSDGGRDLYAAMDNVSALNAVFLASNDESRSAWEAFMSDHDLRAPESDAAATGDAAAATATGSSNDTVAAGDATAATDTAAVSDAAAAAEPGATTFTVPEEFKDYAADLDASWTDPEIAGNVYASEAHQAEIQRMISLLPDGDEDRQAADYFFRHGADLYGQPENGNDAAAAFNVVENILGSHEATAEDWTDFKFITLVGQMQEAEAAA